MRSTNVHLSHLRALLAVADGGSFTHAAETLAVTQSAVSQGVAALEAALGGTLIERDRSGVQLTDLGECVALHGREILARVESIRQEAAAARGLADGKLRIGSFPSVSAAILTPLLCEFRSRFPGIELVLLEGGDAEITQWLENHVVDLGVLTMPAAGDAPTNNGLITMPLGQDEWMAVLPEGHPLAERRAVALKDLGREPFVLSRGGCEARLLEYADQAGVRLRVQYEIKGAATVWTMVRESFGVTIASKLALPADMAGLVTRRIVPQGFRCFGLARLQSVTQPPAVTAFLTLVEKRRSARPHQDKQRPAAAVAPRRARRSRPASRRRLRTR
jgi:DNA-binding transcriptional LysR family regulator